MVTSAGCCVCWCMDAMYTYLGMRESNMHMRIYLLGYLHENAHIDAFYNVFVMAHEMRLLKKFS